MLFAESFGYLTSDDPLRETLNDGRLSHARFADQNGIVLLTPGKNLDRRLDLPGAADHRIKLALAREFRQIAGMLVEVRRGRRRLDTSLFGAATDDLRHLLTQRLWRKAVAFQEIRRQSLTFLGEADEKVFGADIAVAQVVRSCEGACQRVLGTRADADFGRLIGLEVATPCVGIDLSLQVIHRDLERGKNGLDHITFGQGEEKMFGIDLASAKAGCLLGSRLQNLVGLLA